MGTSWVTRYSFLRFLRHVAIQEAKQEILRRSMAETPRFEPYSAFSALDRERKGFISQEDFSVFLKANGQHFSENDFRNLVERLDVNADGRVGVHDFATAVKPLDKLSLSVETSRVQNKSAGLEKDAAECLALFLANEIKLREDHRRRICLLFAQKDFSIHEAFNLFDCDLTGFLTIGHVLEVFQDHTMPLTEEEAVVLFWRLDRDRDGFLSFTDFAGIFFPPCEVRKLRLPQFTDVTPPRLLFTKIKLETILGRNVVDLPSDYICVNHIRLGDRQGTRRPVLISERRLADPHALDTFTLTAHNRSYGAPDIPAKTPLTPPTCCEFCRAASLIYPTKRAVFIWPEIPFLRACGDEGPCSKAMAVAFEVDICAAREVEKCRKELAMRQDFSLAQLWKLFDPNSRGFATNFELRRTLASLGIPLSIRVVNLFLRRYGSAATGASKRITYAGMCDAVMPQDAHASHQLRNRVAKSGSSAFSRVTLFHLLELLKMLMQAEVLAESIRHVFASSTMFAPLRKLDPDNHGVICSKALTDYLKSMGVFATQNEISNLLARYDRKGTGVMSFNRTTAEISCPSLPCACT